MTSGMNFKKEQRVKEQMLAETRFFFPKSNVDEWVWVRKGPIWKLKQNINDPAGHTPTQRIRLSRRRKKRIRQKGA